MVAFWVGMLGHSVSECLRCRKRLLSLLAVLLLLFLGLQAFVQYAEQELTAGMTRTARNRLELYAASLHSVLSKHRYLPYVLARHPAIHRLVTRGDNLDEVNRYLTEVNAAANAMEMFILDTKGVAIASSNWDENASFVGQDYHYRPYFREALYKADTSYFAVGATTGKPGFFFSERIEDEGRLVGLVVVKVDLSPLQRVWRDGGETVFITDETGVIFLSSHDAWRFRATKVLEGSVAATMLAQRQYGHTLPEQLNMQVFMQNGAEMVTIEDQTWLDSRRILSQYRWTIWFLNPVAPLVRRTEALWIVGWGVVCLLLLLVLLAQTLFAWRKARRIAQEAEEIRAMNTRLTKEVQHRIKVEAELLAAQDDLLHAGRMAALGQVAASMVHELSQPVTSMSMLVASCRRLAQHEGHQGLTDTAEHMLSMVQRIKSLIGQLKHFSRKSPGKTAPVRLREVLDNALMVLVSKQEDVGCTPVIACAPDVQVMGDAQQLEQVCINLLHNALDAVSMSLGEMKHVNVTVEIQADTVVLTVTDNGPGIEPAALDKLFTPFYTTKKSGEGIGLGLAIVDHMVHSMHGDIAAHNIHPCGACFILRLPHYVASHVTQHSPQATPLEGQHV